MKELILLACVIMSSYSNSQEFEQGSNLNFKLGVLDLETIHYVFDEGDIVSVQFKEQKGKGIKLVEFRLYDSDIVFSKFKPVEFDEEVEIKKRGVYQIVIENQIGSRVCDLKVKKKLETGHLY